MVKMMYTYLRAIYPMLKSTLVLIMFVVLRHENLLPKFLTYNQFSHIVVNIKLLD